MLFLDSSDPAEVREVFTWGVVRGVTTNPLILSRTKTQALKPRILEVLRASDGPVSVELLATEELPMLREAATYQSWDPDRICIKVPFSETGLKVAHSLAKGGTSVNITCCMSFNQVYLAAQTGAKFVSIFSGRVRDMGYDVRPIITSIVDQFVRDGLMTELIVGSIRHAMDVDEALNAGAHIVTVPTDILRRMMHNPKTEQTIVEFNTAWENRTLTDGAEASPELSPAKTRQTNKTGRAGNRLAVAVERLAAVSGGAKKKATTQMRPKKATTAKKSSRRAK